MHKRARLAASPHPPAAPVRAGSAHPRRRPSTRATAKAARRQVEEYRYWLDRHGVAHFSFEQRIWIERTVAMAFTPVRTLALDTLALNLLALAGALPGPNAARGVGLRAQRRLVERFCEECLLGAPAAGWVLPGPAIRAWLRARCRAESAPPI